MANRVPDKAKGVGVERGETEEESVGSGEYQVSR